MLQYDHHIGLLDKFIHAQHLVMTFTLDISTLELVFIYLLKSKCRGKCNPTLKKE